MIIESVFEFINKTASNSSFMFLFCNCIIILILLGNSKPDSKDKSNSGSKQPMLNSEPVLSSKPGFEKSVLISDPVLSSKPGFEKSVLISKPVLSSKPGIEKSVLISEPSFTSKPPLQQSGPIPESFLSPKPADSDQSLTTKSGLQKMSSGLQPGSDISEKDEKGTNSKTESLEVENEIEVELLRRRVEEFIHKVNTQWKSENTKSNHLVY